jgi:hypothetical protein
VWITAKALPDAVAAQLAGEGLETFARNIGQHEIALRAHEPGAGASHAAGRAGDQDLAAGDDGHGRLLSLTARFPLPSPRARSIEIGGDRLLPSCIARAESAGAHCAAAAWR